MADQYGKIKIGSKEYITSTGTTTTPNLAYYNKGKKYNVKLASGKSSGDVNVNISDSPYHIESFDLPNITITKAAGETVFKASLESGTTASTFGNKSIGLYITRGFAALPSDSTAINLTNIASSQPTTISGQTTTSIASTFYLHVLANINAATTASDVSTTVWDKKTTGTPLGSLKVATIELGSAVTSDEFNASITPIVNTNTITLSTPIEATVVVEKDNDDKWSVKCTDYDLKGNETKIDLDNTYMMPGSSASGTIVGESIVTMRQFFNGTPYKRGVANKNIKTVAFGTCLVATSTIPTSLSEGTTQIQIPRWPLTYCDCFRNV